MGWAVGILEDKAPIPMVIGFLTAVPAIKVIEPMIVPRQLS
jgi:hypothetical protein